MKTFFLKMAFLVMYVSAAAQTVERDPSFNSNNATTNSAVRSIFTQGDGKIVLAGNFNFFQSHDISYIARLHPNGAIDPSFQAPLLNGEIFAMAQQPWDEKIVIAGSFTTVNGYSRPGVARLHKNGSVDESFDPGTGIGGGYDGGIQIWSVVVKNTASPGGRRIIIGGKFQTYDGFQVGEQGSIVQVLENGKRDPAYNPQVSNGPVFAMCLDKNNRLVIGGEFWVVNGQFKVRLARLKENGSLDASFNHTEWVNNSVTSLAVDHNNRIIMGGWFSHYGGTMVNSLVRLNENGSRDESFQTGSGLTDGISTFTNQTEARAFVIAPDNSMIIGGNFTKYNGHSVGNIIAIKEDGSVDSSYVFASGFNDAVMALALQPFTEVDTRILAGGFFNSFKGYAQGYIMRLLPNIEVLAQQFLAVSAQRTAAGVNVAWQVSGTMEGVVYDVLRSTNGREFTPVATLASSTGKTRYFVQDKTAPATALFYKIVARQPGHNNIVSGICQVKSLATAVSIQAYPNPLTGNTLYIQFKIPSGLKKVTLYTAHLKQVQTWRLSGSTAALVIPSSLPAGTYYLQVHEESASHPRVVTIQKK